MSKPNNNKQNTKNKSNTTSKKEVKKQVKQEIKKELSQGAPVGFNAGPDKLRNQKWKPRSGGVWKRPAAQEKALEHVIQNEITLADAQKQLQKAASDPFNVRIPPLGKVAGKPEYLDMVTFDDRIDASLAYSVLYVLNPTSKGLGSVFTSTGQSTAYTLASTADAAFLSNIQTVYNEVRVGIGGLQSVVKVSANARPPVIYVGNSPSGFDYTTTNPGGVLLRNSTRMVNGYYARVSWTPNNIENSSTFTTSALSTGTPNADNQPFIMFIGVDPTVGNSRITTNWLIQTEALRKPDQQFHGAPLGENAQNARVSYDTSQLYEHLDSAFKWASSSHGTSMMQAAAGIASMFWKSDRPIQPPGIDLVDEAKSESYTVYTKFGQFATFSEREIKEQLKSGALSVVCPPGQLAWFEMKYPLTLEKPIIQPPRYACSKSQDGQLLLRLSAVQPKYTEDEDLVTCTGCGQLSQKVCCDECLRNRAEMKLQDDLGVQSVDSTPESVRRQLENLKLQLTGKYPIQARGFVPEKGPLLEISRSLQNVGNA